MDKKIIVARSYQAYNIYCKMNGFNPRQYIFISTEDKSTWDKLAGLKLTKEQLIILDFPPQQLNEYIQSRKVRMVDNFDYSYDEEITVVMTRKVFDFQTSPLFRANLVHYPGTLGWCITLKLPHGKTIEINPRSSDFVGIVKDKL